MPTNIEGIFTFDSDKFLNLGFLTDSVAEIVELGASNLTASDHVNLNDVRRVNGEGLLNTATVSYAANRECFGDTAAVTCDNSALKHLDSLSCAFLDLVVDSYRITDVKLGYGFLKLLTCKSVDLVHFRLLL